MYEINKYILLSLYLFNVFYCYICLNVIKYIYYCKNYYMYTGVCILQYYYCDNTVSIYIY